MINLEDEYRDHRPEHKAPGRVAVPVATFGMALMFLLGSVFGMNIGSRNQPCRAAIMSADSVLEHTSNVMQLGLIVMEAREGKDSPKVLSAVANLQNSRKPLDEANERYSIARSKCLAQK